MRIGLVIYGSLDTLSGGFLYDRMLVERLRRSGHTVDVIPLPWRTYAAHLLDNGRTGLLNHLRQADYDVLLQDELNHPSLFLLNRRLRPTVSTPIVSIVHHLRTSERHPPALRPLYRWVERRYLQGVDAFVYNSRTTQRAVEGVLGDAPRHVVALPSGSHVEGVGPEAIARRAAEGGPLRVAFVGNLIPRKGLHTLLDALARPPANTVRLTVIGDTGVDPGHTRAIRRRVETLGLGARVEVTGRLADEALAARLAASDVLTVPSRYEGFGIVYLEGMAFGLPAIATTSGGAQEIVTPGVDGFLVPPGDTAALAECLGGLASDRERLREMSLAARRRFESHPGWDDTTAQIEAFLTSL